MQIAIYINGVFVDRISCDKPPTEIDGAKLTTTRTEGYIPAWCDLVAEYNT